jgi:hypothetical protein
LEKSPSRLANEEREFLVETIVENFATRKLSSASPSKTLEEMKQEKKNESNRRPGSSHISKGEGLLKLKQTGEYQDAATTVGGRFLSRSLSMNKSNAHS